jgi:FdrA protein
MNVMLFSDNVSEVDEVELKRYGRDHNLLVMGPDCGTAIINGVPLAFANVVKRGPIGVIAASGTGLQQVTSLIDRYGSGVSQAIGTGGHDLHESIGGITMLQAFGALQGDPDTELIVLVSKPPAPSVASTVVAAAEKSSKPVVINFLGPDAREDDHGNIQFARTLEDAARAAVARVKRRAFTGNPGIPDETAADLGRRRARLGTGKYVRGLFSGGTFCYEALILTSEILGPVYSNTAFDSAYALEDVWVSRNHSLVDLGDDAFTRGRPHPMIDHRLRNDRIIQEARDPETAVILLDVVLGYGSHLDPAAEMAPALAEARRAAGVRDLVVIASVCGTEGDQQNLRHQERVLADAGVLLARSNAQAARFAAEVVRGLA